MQIDESPSFLPSHRRGQQSAHQKLATPLHLSEDRGKPAQHLSQLPTHHVLRDPRRRSTQHGNGSIQQSVEAMRTRRWVQQHVRLISTTQKQPPQKTILNRLLCIVDLQPTANSQQTTNASTSSMKSSKTLRGSSALDPRSTKRNLPFTTRRCDTFDHACQARLFSPFPLEINTNPNIY